MTTKKLDRLNVIAIILILVIAGLVVGLFMTDAILTYYQDPAQAEMK